MSSKSKKSSANGGDENDPNVRVAKIGTVEIKYRIREDPRGSHWVYVELDDPEVLAQKINEKQRKTELKGRERQTFRQWQDRLAQRLRELQYTAIPEMELQLSVFRAKHILQCVQVRLADIWEKLIIKDGQSTDKGAPRSVKQRCDTLESKRGEILEEIKTFQKIHDDVKSFDTGEYTEELKKLNDIINQLNQLEKDYKEPREYVERHYSASSR